MIAGIFHQGSGLGNQLHRYVATRALAEKKGVEWGMVGVDYFKGKSFMNLNMGGVVDSFLLDLSYEYHEKKVTENGVDIRGYDPEFNFIEGHTVIDGEFQDERYWKDHDVDSWLKVEPLEVPDDVCVIGFRGGEYYTNPDLGLPVDYFYKAIGMVKSMLAQQGITVKFEVHTDDVEMAKTFFPDTSINTFKVIHDIGLNWRSMRYAKHAIIANSSFYILPRWLSGGVTIAPRYWARHNTKTWSMNQNYYDRFMYI